MTTAEAKQLDERAMAALVDPSWRTPPLRHQLQTIAWALDLPRPRVAIWNDIGTGKTLTALYCHMCWGFRRLMVCCPNSCVEGWLDEVKKHTPVHARALTGSAAERTEALAANECPIIFVVNWEGLKVLFADRGGGAKGKGWLKDPARLAEAVRAARIDACVFDETQLAIADPASHQGLIAAELGRQADKVVELTGTPFGGKEEQVWGQLRAMDPWWAEARLGKSVWSFRGRWCEPDPDSEVFVRKLGRKVVGRYRVREDRREQLMAVLAERAIRFTREDCADLPGKTYVQRFCDLTADQRAAIDAVLEGEDFDGPGGVVPAKVMACGNKLAQISGGVLLTPEGARRFNPCPKLDLLMEVLGELNGRKAIVYHAFVEEGRAIEDRLRAAGIGYASLRGEISDADRSAGLARFREDPRCVAMVAHPRSGGVGLNLQCASVVIFFSHGLVSAPAREQSEGRVWRQGQGRPCLFVNLVARGSLDEARLDRLADDRAVLAGVLDHIRGACNTLQRKGL